MKRERKGPGKNSDEYRIGVMLEAAMASSVYKNQGREVLCAKLYLKQFAHVPGLYNVGISRVRTAGDNFFPPGEMPTALDINLQRLNPFVIESEIFERAVRMKSLFTLLKYSKLFGKNYGKIWDDKEIEILGCFENTFNHEIPSNVGTIRNVIRSKFNKDCEDNEIQCALDKIYKTAAKMMREKYLI